MTLAEIRLAKSFEDLKPAIRYLADNMLGMTYGEFIAYRRTLEDQATNIGVSLQTINEYATNYQIFGEN